MMIPKQSYGFSAIVATLYFFFSFSFVLHTLASPILHYCRHDQRDALLEFKHEFPVNESDSNANHMSTWNKSSDCCSWEGVSCDAKSGKVTSLDVGFNSLNNSLKPHSGLFKLHYLETLALSSCNLYGEIPSSLGNLSHLMYLDFSHNELVGHVPASIGNLTQLRSLRLVRNNLNGKIPVSLANLTKLVTLDLNDNYFESELPPTMSGLHSLEYLYLSGNSFSGPFPTFLFTIPSLQVVYMRRNQLKFNGPIEFGNTSSSSRLHSMCLASNKLDGSFPESISKFLNLKILDLSFNNIVGPIPKSISQLVNVQYLDLSSNRLEGKVPGCLWRLVVLELSYNSFSRFGKPSEVLNGAAQMSVLSLWSNSFQGPFPQWICKFRSLNLLDMSENSFSGSIPACLRNVTNLLRELNLRDNKFSGTLPADMFANATNLRALDVSRNRLEGKLSKSLTNCKALKILNVGSNNFKDQFPYWLGSLPSLNVLILRSNHLYGPLYHHHPHVSIGLQKLRIIDVSQNDFSGTFPAFYFSSWRDMTTSIAQPDEAYMEEFLKFTAYYRNPMEMVQKGVDTQFEAIRKDFKAIDFSGNKFSGRIPESIGLLKGLRLLNLSRNAFTSDIPQSLANLTNLEALDLSQNQLLGRIPQDLGLLTFLSTMNFSHNNLEGPIPQGPQFESQSCSSFMDNSRLYGLEEICGKTHVLNPTPQESDEEQVFNWIAAAIACGPGVFCGFVIGHIFISHKHESFMEKLRRNKP